MLLLLFILILGCAEAKVKQLPIIVTTWSAEGFQQATKNALDNLGGGRMHALVEGLSTCERMQCDTTVGFGGSPDETGETTLDALLMDGPGHRVGAVANLHQVKDAARVAWAVMNFTKHTMIVGPAATEFAKSMGFTVEDISTEASKKVHTDWQANNCQPNYWINVTPDAGTKCGPYKPSLANIHARPERHVKIDRFNHDTIGMVVVDEKGNLSAGTSTNGAKFRIAGRVGDSPMPGSGAYLAEGVGAAAATGDGDVMMRFLPSFQTVEFMRQGTKPGKAARKALQRILAYYPSFQGAVVAANVAGEHGAACTNMKLFKYSVGFGAKVQIESVQCLPINGTVSHQKVPSF